MKPVSLAASVYFVTAEPEPGMSASFVKPLILSKEKGSHLQKQFQPKKKTKPKQNKKTCAINL